MRMYVLMCKYGIPYHAHAAPCVVVSRPHLCWSYQLKAGAVGAAMGHSADKDDTNAVLDRRAEVVALVLDASQCADTDAGRFTVTQQVRRLTCIDSHAKAPVGCACHGASCKA